MSASFPWLKMTLTTVGIVGAGWVTMKLTVPTPEETYAALAPDLRKKVDANRAARLAQENEMKQQVAAQFQDSDTAKPIWADSSNSSRQ